jgi:DNA-binding CsgD family transcriptional regulator
MLTLAEQEVTRLILRGCGNREIALLLNYSPGYVKNLATSVYGKLNVSGRTELRMLFRRQG